MVVTAAFLASLFTLAIAKPTARSDFIVHEQRPAAPQGFTSLGAAPSDTSINLRIGLVSNDMPGLEKALYAVSTPSSPQYGQHLSKDEVKAFVAPTGDALAAVNSWLSDHGLNATSASPAGDWLNVRVPVSKANELLNANYEVFTHSESGRQAIRSLSYSIPANLQTHIETIHPTTAFDVIMSGLSLSSPKSLNIRAVPASCATITNPTCLQALYGIPTTPATQSSNTLAVSGFSNVFAEDSDLQSFLAQFRPGLTSSFTLETLDGGQNSQGPGLGGDEASLDIQYTVGLATDVPVVFVMTGNAIQDSIGGFLDEANFLLANHVPTTLTTSFGFNEADLSPSLATKLCNTYMQLGAAGTSNLFASGDGGVSGGQSQPCTVFQPTFPAGCPFITSVGATQGISPETAAPFSSGGFSNFFGSPSYQTSSVTKYLHTLGSTNSGLFNRSGRAYPDISAQGVNAEIILNGQESTVSGTSCSSPIFASVFALINDRLIAAGKPPLGFLNPWLYANAGALNDITTGSNPGCNTNGFPAMTGWDPVTGLGTPNFAKLLAAAGL